MQRSCMFIKMFYFCNMATEKIKSRYDKFGIFSALLCIVHCTLLPVAVALIVNIDQPDSHFSHTVHIVFIVVSLGAVFFSSRNSSSPLIKTALWFFVFVFISGVVIEDYFAFGKIISLAGSAGLVVSHFFNLRQCRKCEQVSIS